jgi:hypothetical protein
VSVVTVIHSLALVSRSKIHMKIDLMETQTQPFPIYDDSEQIGMLVPDHNGYLVATRDGGNWQSAENETYAKEIQEGEGSFRQFDETDGAEKFCIDF